MQAAEYPTFDILASVIPDHDILTSSGYFKAVNQGVSGDTLKKIVQIIDDREVFAKVIGKDRTNLSKSYRVTALPKLVGDSVIDTLRVYLQATRIYGSLDLASEWLHSSIPALGGEHPVNLLDSHAGRELVRQTLHKIERGEYS
jgi:putative toxin-antitoxin system antitoxin component (TIGR02293 family)